MNVMKKTRYLDVIVFKYDDRDVVDPSKWFWGGRDCEEEGKTCCLAFENVW